ncbi:RDD family protein [Sulfuricurvum sp.]|uniref:RDD family protein n=1 Tax=Sulfuricurvum sp. TaxID=2025608 RepID=UPI002635E23A|nr:RDD family protein [Sulfuricurvum sp.]MDD2265517.1 RDD family protein [Sulfuricurvum sp.]MDD2783375.1 RDD family protein [Sulfuricurvum sp.]HZF69826.1 RDD family protein [Sulfuricurvum sp.]
MDEQLDTLIQREHLELASIRQRAAAFGIDEVLLSVLLMIILWDTMSKVQTLEAMISVTNSFLLEYMSIKIIYQTFFTMQYGGSIGKIIMKIRVIEIATLSNPGFLSSFNRSVFRVISEALFYLGFVWAILDPYRRSWHDRTARTLVINA